MLALRYVYLLALVVWLGGLLVLGGIAAPAIFTSIAGAQGAAARELAGAVFGEVLRRFHLVAYAASAVMIVSLVVIAALGPRPVRFAVRLAIVAVMAALTLYSGLVVAPQVQRMQREIAGPVASLAESDPRRARFGRLHRNSTLLLGLSALGGALLLYWEARTND